MKLFAYILSFIVLALTANPCIDKPVDDILQKNVLSQKQECCLHCNDSGSQNPVPPEQDNSGGVDCNPLMSCNACAGFTFSFSAFSFAPIQHISELRSMYKPSAVPEITLPIWQPPKIS